MFKKSIIPINFKLLDCCFAGSMKYKALLGSKLVNKDGTDIVKLHQLFNDGPTINHFGRL